MFVRVKQLDQLRNSISDSTIKVIYGARRVGKTTLLDQFRTFLRRQGVTRQRIIYRNFDRLVESIVCEPQAVIQSIKKELTKGKTNYVFLDELEFVPNYREVVDQLSALPQVDLYVTSSEDGIKALAAAYPCQLVYLGPLSFREFSDYHQQEASLATLHQYLNTGGFPFAQTIRNHSSIQNYFEEVISTTIINAFARQDGLCNPRLAMQLAIFLTNHIGCFTNVSQTVTALQKLQINVSNKTLAAYLDFLQRCFLFAPCPALSHRTGKAKTTNLQYFPVDSCFNWLLTNRHGALSATNLTTVVFNELRSRGFDVYTGADSKYPVSFIATRQGQRHFFQFSYSLLTATAYRQACAGLLHAPKDCPRTLIIARPNLDQLHRQTDLRTVSLVDWLME